MVAKDEKTGEPVTPYVTRDPSDACWKETEQTPPAVTAGKPEPTPTPTPVKPVKPVVKPEEDEALNAAGNVLTVEDRTPFVPTKAVRGTLPLPDLSQPGHERTFYFDATPTRKNIGAGVYDYLRDPYDFKMGAVPVSEQDRAGRGIWSGNLRAPIPQKNKTLLAQFGGKCPHYMGNKNAMTERTVGTICEKMSPSEREHYTSLVDCFGGGGCWGLTLALTCFPNANNLVINEFDESRATKIRLLQTHGEKLADECRALLDRCEGLYDAIPAKAKTNVASFRVAFWKTVNTYPLTAEEQGMARAIFDVMASIVGGFGEQDKVTGKFSYEAQIEKTLKTIAADATNATELAQAYAARGGHITYVCGDAKQVETFGARIGADGTISRTNAEGDEFRVPHGDNVMKVCDPPYYLTEGYSDDGSSTTVGFEHNPFGWGYRDTQDMLKKLVDFGDGICYTDEAWFYKENQVKNKNAAQGELGLLGVVDEDQKVLLDIINSLDHFDVAGMVAKRYETLGIQHGHNNNESAEKGAGDGRLRMGDVSESGREDVLGRGHLRGDEQDVGRVESRTAGEDEAVVRGLDSDGGRGNGADASDASKRDALVERADREADKSLAREACVQTIENAIEENGGERGADTDAVVRHALASVADSEKAELARELLEYVRTGKTAAGVNYPEALAAVARDLPIAQKVDAMRRDVPDLDRRQAEAIVLDAMEEQTRREYDAVVAAHTNADGTRKPTWMKAPNGEPTKLTERQWVQVRTPAFKAWFGDWENDPANASKVVDENGEPRVVYHGTENGGFTVFDSRYNREYDDGSRDKGFFFAANLVHAESYSGTSDVLRADTDGEFYPEVEMVSVVGSSKIERLHRQNYGIFLNIRNPREVDMHGREWNEVRTGEKNPNLVSISDLSDELQEKVCKEYADETGVALEYDEEGLWENYVECMEAVEAYFRQQNGEYDDDFNLIAEGADPLFDKETGEYKENPEFIETTRTFTNRELGNGNDGIIFNNIFDLGRYGMFAGPTCVYVAINPNQIKSATDNTGTFSAGDADIRYSLSSSFDEVLPSADILDQLGRLQTTDRFYDGRRYVGASENAVYAVENGRLPLQSIYALFDAKGEHKDFLKRLFTDETTHPEWHHLGKKANEVLWQNRDEYNTPITDVTVFAALNYKQGASPEAIDEVLKIDREAAEKLNDIASRLKGEHTRDEMRTRTEKTEVPEARAELTSINREMREKYQRIPKEEYNKLIEKRREIQARLYRDQEVERMEHIVPTQQEVTGLLNKDGQAQAIVEQAKKNILKAFGRTKPSGRKMDKHAAEKVLVDLVTDTHSHRTRFSIGADERITEALEGIDEQSISNALEGLISNGDIDIRGTDGERLAAKIAAQEFFKKYAKMKIQLSTGAVLFFAPDEATLERNGGDTSAAWAEYALHQVTSNQTDKGGKNYRAYNKSKVEVVNPILEKIVLEDKAEVNKNGNVIFYSQVEEKAFAQVIAKPLEDGNYRADLSDVTSVYTKGKVPDKLNPLVEVVDKDDLGGVFTSKSTPRIIPYFGRGSQGGISRHSIRTEREARWKRHYTAADIAWATDEIADIMAENGYTEHVWHGTIGKDFNIFRASDDSHEVPAVYLSYQRGTAENYAYLRSQFENFDFEYDPKTANIRDFYVNPGRVYEYDEAKEQLDYEDFIALIKKVYDEGYDSMRCIGLLDDHGHRLGAKDAHPHMDKRAKNHGPMDAPLPTDVLIVFDRAESPAANRIKAADPVTFDDAGFPISSLLRGDRKSPDVRYSIASAREAELTEENKKRFSIIAGLRTVDYRGKDMDAPDEGTARLKHRLANFNKAAEMYDEIIAKRSSKRKGKKPSVPNNELLTDKENRHIWLETGWWQGVDGEWRIEIGSPDPKRFCKKPPTQIMTRRLDEIMEQDDLFEVYPELRNVIVTFDPQNTEGAQGAAYANVRAFHIGFVTADAVGENGELTDGGMNSLTHEVQHMVQYLEGRDDGSPTYFYPGPNATLGEQRAALLSYAQNELEVEARMAASRSLYSPDYNSNDTINSFLNPYVTAADRAKAISPMDARQNELGLMDGKIERALAKQRRNALTAPRGVQKQAGTNYPDAAWEIAAVEQTTRFSIGSKKAAEYRALIAKKRPDLDAAEIDATMGEIAKFETPKAQKAALHWYVRGRLRLPEDAPKVEQALAYAEKAKADPMQFDGPVELMEALHDFKPKAKPIDPDTVPYLSDKREMGHGVVTYLVDESRESQQAMREIINTHWGEDANPWCLLQGDGKGNLSDGTNGYNARHYWEHYSSLPKRVAFLNGKLLAFSAINIRDAHKYYKKYNKEWNFGTLYEWVQKNHPDDLLWWDRIDRMHEHIPMGNKPIPNDRFGRWGNYELVDGEIVRGKGFEKGMQGQDGYRKWKDDEDKYLLLEAQDNGVRRTWGSDGMFDSYLDEKRGIMFMTDRAGEKFVRLISIPAEGETFFTPAIIFDKGGKVQYINHNIPAEQKEKILAFKAEADRILAEEEANNPNYKANGAGTRFSLGVKADETGVSQIVPPALRTTSVPRKEDVVAALPRIIPYFGHGSQGGSLPHINYHREDEWRNEADESARHALARGPHSAQESVEHGHRIYSVEGIKIAALSPTVRRVLSNRNSADNAASMVNIIPSMRQISTAERKKSHIAVTQNPRNP